MKFALESYDQMINEIKPLIEAHYDEIAKYKDIPLDPDWDLYRKLEEVGILKAFSCRATDDNSLIGYAIYFVKPHIHYRSMLLAQQDILFIKKEFRGRGIAFILWCDEQLKAMGCTVSMHHVKAEHNFGRMLERIGYELMDLIYTRRL